VKRIELLTLVLVSVILKGVQPLLKSFLSATFALPLGRALQEDRCMALDLVRSLCCGGEGVQDRFLE
jgi:hypothetical protein